MLLAIDIGNSNIVIGCMNGMQIENEFRIATDFVKTSDQYCIDLKNVLSLCDIHVQDLEGVIISSVVPPHPDRQSGADRKRPDRCSGRGTARVFRTAHGR